VKIVFFTLLLAITPISVFAFFCPNTFNQIEIGDTIEQVEKQCGKPDSQTEKEIKKPVPEEWNYYIPQTVGGNSLTPMQGTLKTSFTFDASGKAINISVNGIGVGSTTICGSNVQLGDTRDTIKAACGSASIINKQLSENDTKDQAANKMIIFNYKSNPPTTLTFENGKLTARN